MGDDKSSDSGRLSKPRVPEGMKALLIDDSELVLHGLGDALVAIGFEVRTRSTSVGAQAVILRERPDVVIVDVTMPLMTGDELTRAIKGTAALRNVRVLLISDRPESEMRSLIEASGADGAVLKTDPATMARAVARFVGQSSTDRSVDRGIVLFACNSLEGQRMARAVGAQLSDSGMEAMRLVVSRNPPSVVVLGTSLSDLPAERLLRIMVDRDRTWRRRLIVLTDDGVTVPAWASEYPILAPHAALEDVVALVKRVRAAA